MFMKKVFLRWCVSLLGLICFLFFSSCSHMGNSEHLSKPLLSVIKERGKIIAGVKFDSRPFGYLDADGQLKGFDIDLLHELAKRILGHADAVEFQQVLSSTRVLALNTGNVDVVAATMTITPERKKVINFSNSYYLAGQAIIIPKDSPVQQLADLAYKTIIFVLGTTSEQNIKRLLPHAHYLGFKTSIEAFSALKAGRGDAMTTDDTILAGFMQEVSCQFRMLPQRLSQEPYGLAFRKDGENDDASFIQAVNQALDGMKQDGTLEQLSQKWVGQALQHKNATQTTCTLPSLS
jgi:putative glutamine transport system substrate-binding protein